MIYKSGLLFRHVDNFLKRCLFCLAFRVLCYASNGKPVIQSYNTVGNTTLISEKLCVHIALKFVRKVNNNAVKMPAKFPSN